MDKSRIDPGALARRLRMVVTYSLWSWHGGGQAGPGGWIMRPRFFPAAPGVTGLALRARPGRPAGRSWLRQRAPQCVQGVTTMRKLRCPGASAQGPVRRE